MLEPPGRVDLPESHRATSALLLAAGEVLELPPGRGFATQLSFLKETGGQQLLQTLAWGSPHPTEP